MDLQLNWTTCVAVAGYIALNPAVRQAIGWGARAAVAVHWRRLTVPAYVLALVVALMAGTPAAGQHRRGPRGTNGAGSNSDPSLAAVAEFTGVIKGKDKKKLSVELEAGNTVDFLISKKTAYYYGTKEIQWKDLTVDSDVKIDGRKDAFGGLTALKVSVKLPAAPEK